MKPGIKRAINPHLLTGAHALGALPDAERIEFEAHLGRCRSCAEESAGLRETAARLGNAVDHVLPNALRPRVLAAVRHVRQVPPASETGTVSSRRQGFRRAAVLVSAACVVAAAVAAPDLRLVTAGDPAGTAVMSSSRNEMVFLAGNLRTLPHDRVYQLWLVDDHGPRSAGTLRPTGGAMMLLVTEIEGVSEAMLTVEPAGGSPGPTSAPVLTITFP
ncbi:anti-sigma factor [Lentzea sp. NPDC054927]